MKMSREEELQGRLADAMADLRELDRDNKILRDALQKRGREEYLATVNAVLRGMARKEGIGAAPETIVSRATTIASLVHGKGVMP